VLRVLRCLALTLLTSRISAQANVPQFRGDFGLSSGTQPPPGWYTAVLYNYYNPDELITSDGATIHGVTIDQSVLGLSLQWVSKFTLLGGAHYSAVIAIAWANTVFEVPTLTAQTKWGFSDSYVQPVNLGWHFSRVDVLGTLGVYIPTGRFTAGATDNTGLGMWAVELGAAATVYPDAAKQFNIATYATYDAPVSDVEGTDKRAGDVVTLEGGVGHTIVKDFGGIGVAYYAQWKVTSDQGFTLPAGFQSKDSYFGIGPEVSVPIPIVKTVPFILTGRYFFELGNRVATQGNSFYVIFTVAKPS
jgi:hypothetical protein